MDFGDWRLDREKGSVTWSATSFSCKPLVESSNKHIMENYVFIPGILLEPDSDLVNIM